MKQHARSNARIANRFYSSMELPQPPKQEATTVIRNALSMAASANLTTPTMSPIRLNRQARQLSHSNKPLKGRMTIEEVKAALEPITRAREQQSLMRNHHLTCSSL
jgi:hypothetical protein